MPKLHLQGRQLLLEPMPLQCLEERTLLNQDTSARYEKVVDVFHEQAELETVDAKVSRVEQRLDLGGEWFDGTSGMGSQNRCLTREEAIERIRKRQMRDQIAVMLKEIERDETDG